jgi:Ala-tRNA(Pro) deacylase
MDCKERLSQYLGENGVAFEILTHSKAYTMQEVAAEVHESGKQVAKVVMVKADGRDTMLVVPASHRLNFSRVGKLLNAERVSLAKEENFAALFPDCAPGAMPPFGNLYHVPVYVDQALADQDEIVFRVGTHRDSMRVSYEDYYRLVQPTVGEFAWLP